MHTFDMGAEELEVFSSYLEYQRSDVQLLLLVDYLSLEDLVVCAGADARFRHFTEGRIYNRYVSPFSTSKFLVCLECGWSYNEAGRVYSRHYEPRFNLTATTPPSNNRLAKNFLVGFAGYQLELAETRIDAYHRATNPRPITCLKILLGCAYSSIATTSMSIEWSTLFESVLKTTKHSLQFLCVCHVHTRLTNSFVSLQLKTIHEALSQPGAYPILTHLTTTNEFLCSMSDEAARHLARTVEYLDISNCIVHDCFAPKFRSYGDFNENEQQPEEIGLLAFPRVQTLILDALELDNNKIEIHKGPEKRAIYRSLPSVRNILARSCYYSGLAEPYEGAYDTAGHMSWAPQILPKFYTFEFSLHVDHELDDLVQEEPDDEKQQQHPLPEKVLKLCKRIKVHDKPIEFDALAVLKYIRDRDNYAEYFAPVHNLHCYQRRGVKPPPPPTTFQNENVLRPPIEFEFELENVYSRIYGVVLSGSDIYWQMHKQVFSWLQRFELMCYCEHEPKQQEPKYYGASFSICADDTVNAPQVACSLQISQLSIRFNSYPAPIDNLTDLNFYLSFKFKAILHALVGNEEELNEAATCDFKLFASKLAKKSRQILPTPLLHVRRIVMFCTVRIGNNLFYGRHDADVVAGHSNALPAPPINSSGNEAALICIAPPLSTAGRFELLSQKFRSDYLKPLIGLVAERFVRLRYFSIVCTCNEQATVYNFDDAVLSKRVEQFVE